jgi:hypothetical protein
VDNNDQASTSTPIAPLDNELFGPEALRGSDVPVMSCSHVRPSKDGKMTELDDCFHPKLVNWGEQTEKHLVQLTSKFTYPGGKFEVDTDIIVDIYKYLK